MADVQDVDQDLQRLARQVPADTRSHMTEQELRLRCEEAARLLFEADMAESRPNKAMGLRKKAKRLLAAVSPAAYWLHRGELEEALRKAMLEQAHALAADIQQELLDFDRDNPQVSDETIIAAAEAAIAKLRSRIPPVPSNNSMSASRRRSEAHRR